MAGSSSRGGAAPWSRHGREHARLGEADGMIFGRTGMRQENFRFTHADTLLDIPDPTPNDSPWKGGASRQKLGSKREKQVQKCV
jgi:hypothetical protein